MRALTADGVLRLLTWPAALFIACILLWYEQYKLTGHPGSTFLFTVLTDWLGFHGHEKFMRIGVGSAEILTSILVVIPPTRLLGALGAVALMSGAIFFHLVSPLGVDPYNDGGGLFTQACEALASALFIVLALRADLPDLASRVPFIGRTLSGLLRRTSAAV
ncbi:MAG TPA: hypothetical protein VGC15_17985 [Acetobacteraceae bacterium]